MNPLKIAVVPMDIVEADVEANLRTAESLLATLEPRTDVAVLPELFTTAFIADAETLRRVAQTNDGPAMQAVSRWAASHGFAVAGSFIATDPDRSRFYNRCFLTEPSGETTFYDKAHLFAPSGEAALFTPGSRLSPVARFRGWNIRLFVCYDLRFPLWCRNTDLCYDLALFPANWGGARAYAFEHLLIARAIENQACTAGCNRLGSDPYGEYPLEMSGIYNHLGKPVGSRRPDGVIHATLDPEAMLRMRRKFPVALDADPFTLNR